MAEEEKSEEEVVEELEKLEEVLEKELSVPIPIAITPPEHTKLLDRLNVMDEKVEFVAGELAQKQGEKIGTALGILYGAVVGILLFVMFLI
jgi:tetrahydromethanopterin S-methyltransferase subunit G|uniref:Tetrahydromethanopterin S-methyltransferase subunit G n=1 Tax=Uncultured archaeon GZfos26G2 TaxID=3386331 RepID=Q649Y5_UNCAG|nr:N(5)-methyl-tetrahydromethanopterin-coenzyme M methyltransferase subunit G [uncultured archaeon GZfos34A6]